MGYLEEFQTQINRRDFPKFLQLWEEYCTSDPVDIEEFSQLLQAIKSSELAKLFGQIVETALPMWETIPDKNDSFLIMKLLIDLQQTNSPTLYNIAISLLKQKYGHDPKYEDRLRLAGIRTSDNFQGALSNYELLAHLAKGKFVYHSGGWGTGEIVDVSFLREQITIEFENVPGKKHLSLANAFKVLAPLADESFLARRFGDPDALEKEAKEDPLSVIKLLLSDLGPKTSSELKDELCGLVIPEEDWTKWWQTVRAKLKKDTMIEAPETVRDLFKLRKTEVRHEDRLIKAISSTTDPTEILTTAYTFARDFPSVLKDAHIKSMLREKLLFLIADHALNAGHSLQAHIFLEDYLAHQFPEKTLEKLIQSDLDFEAVLDTIDLAGLKKRVLTLVRQSRKDWPDIFLKMLFSNQQSTLRDYLCKELNQEHREMLEKKLQTLLKAPQMNPEMFIWYFQLLISKGHETLPFGTKEGIGKWFEGLLILLHQLEFKPEARDLSKKIYMMISGKRYALVRQILEGSSLPFAEEFLLLASKAQTFTESEQKILRSLAAVIHPSLGKKSAKHPHFDSHVIWTTEGGFFRIQERVREIGTTEIVANAREIEAARALGDLRENSEYKFALEKRSRLQSELKALSEQLGRARIITKVDVSADEVSIGSIVELIDSKNNALKYTILGPWDADPDQNILSLQSKFVQTMLGCKKDDKFNFRDEEYQVISLKTIFD
jgi:transcription elongation factor GreA-like protein/transcription elongation GreA/GreB family factor